MLVIDCSTHWPPIRRLRKVQWGVLLQFAFHIKAYYVGKNGHYKIIGDTLDYEAALQQLKMPVLAVYIEGDWLSPKTAMEHLYQKFNVAAPITNFTLTRKATGVNLNHFNWVKNSEDIVKAIKDWISF